MPEDKFVKVAENGRTYHKYKDGKYLLPNDEQELDRLDLQHRICYQLFGDRLFLAPINTKSIENVLDLATGSGVWACEFALEYPDAKVIGTDLTPVSEQGVPPNCHFMVEDVEDDWTFPAPFSYIHGRAALSVFNDPSLTVFRKAFDALAPGGYFELQNPLMPMGYASPPPADSAVVRWNELTVQASQAAGRMVSNVRHYARWMRETGFVEVEERKYVLPTGSWEGDPLLQKLGGWQLLNMLNAMEGLTLRNLGRIGWSADDCKKLASEVRDELESGKLKVFHEIYIVWGRKPL